MTPTVLHADCMYALKGMPAESVDSLVTDPPASISFMGKAWDHHKGGRQQWVEWMTDVMRECLRVLKPGAHALVWALPRTSHWTVTAIEDAGFEVRDVRPRRKSAQWHPMARGIRPSRASSSCAGWCAS